MALGSATLQDASTLALQDQRLNSTHVNFHAKSDARSALSNPQDDGFSTDTFLATRNDERDLNRMGKQPQLRRHFREISTISLVCVLVSTWEVLFLANAQGLTDGGLAGLFWSYLWTLVGFALIAASLAEMASMAPTAAGMYHWVSEFAPPRYQRFMSYITGWMSTLSWQAGNASGAFIAGTVIQSLLGINDPTYVPQNWQGTLFVFATVLLIFIVNTYFIRWLPMLQNALMFIHVSTFLAITIVLWIKAPHASARDVFQTFTNSGNWSSMGLSLMVGQITAVYGLVGSDTAAHMSEEVRDAGLAVPKAMLWSFAINGIMGLVFLITFLFAIPDIDAAQNDPSGYSFIYILQNALPNSPSGVNAIVSFLIVLSLASNISFNASTSRQTFAFARDGGLPFSKWISHVHPRLLIPFNAILLSCIISCLLSLIYVGSPSAFNAIISLFLVALMSTYVVSIGCILYKRISSPQTMPAARWKMSPRIGIVTNVGALLYSAFVFFWCFWPNTTVQALGDFNWAVVIFIGVFVIAIVMYWLQGKKYYKAPVDSVLRRGHAVAY